MPKTRKASGQPKRSAAAAPSRGALKGVAKVPKRRLEPRTIDAMDAAPMLASFDATVAAVHRRLDAILKK